MVDTRHHKTVVLPLKRCFPVSRLIPEHFSISPYSDTRDSTLQTINEANRVCVSAGKTLNRSFWFTNTTALSMVLTSIIQSSTTILTKKKKKTRRKNLISPRFQALQTQQVFPQHSEIIHKYQQSRVRHNTTDLF